jgi:hypothetical protein
MAEQSPFTIPLATSGCLADRTTLCDGTGSIGYHHFSKSILRWHWVRDPLATNRARGRQQGALLAGSVGADPALQKTLEMLVAATHE